MKKIIYIGLLLLIVIIIFMALGPKFSNKYMLNLDMSVSSNVVNTGDEVEYIIKTDKTIVACNFNIIYDKDVLEFVESTTPGLYADVNDEKVACIYVDMTNIGINEFKIKFKAIKNTSETQLGITNVKFREKDKDTSYVDTDINGVNQKIKVKIQ